MYQPHWSGSDNARLPNTPAKCPSAGTVAPISAQLWHQHEQERISIFLLNTTHQLVKKDRYRLW